MAASLPPNDGMAAQSTYPVPCKYFDFVTVYLPQHLPIASSLLSEPCEISPAAPLPIHYENQEAWDFARQHAFNPGTHHLMNRGSGQAVCIIVRIHLDSDMDVRAENVNWMQTQCWQMGIAMSLSARTPVLFDPPIDSFENVVLDGVYLWAKDNIKSLYKDGLKRKE